MDKISLVFFATPDIALKSFISLADDDNFEIKALVTQPQRPKGRGKKIEDSKIKKEAIARNITVFEPFRISKDEDVIAKLLEIKPDFFVTFAFGQILSQRVLDIPKFETINLHASLLPKYRGANPICECLLNGDEETGITTMVTVLELDAGDICLSDKINLGKNTNFEELSNIISNRAPKLIKDTLTGLYNKTLCTTKQDSSCATFTKKTEKKDKILDFNLPACKVHNKIRAFCGINTTHFSYKNKIVKVLESVEIDYNLSKTPGEVLDVSKDGIMIGCLYGAIIIKKVKPEGKNVMSSYDWSLGSKIQKGEIIECTQGE